MNLDQGFGGKFNQCHRIVSHSALELFLLQPNEEIFRDFPTYNREWERRQWKRMEREMEWEAELKQLMDASSSSSSAAAATVLTPEQRS